MADRVVVDLPCKFSDGLSTKWPQGEYVWAPADTLYVQKLADLGKELIEGSRHGKSLYFQSFLSSAEQMFFARLCQLRRLYSTF